MNLQGQKEREKDMETVSEVLDDANAKIAKSFDALKAQFAGLRTGKASPAMVDGIKVAFVTSIFGISLSLMYTYWMRGAITGMSESLDNFLDKYYLCAVSPTDATAMNHVLSNQKESIRSPKIAGTLFPHIISFCLSKQKCRAEIAYKISD